MSEQGEGRRRRGLWEVHYRVKGENETRVVLADRVDWDALVDWLAGKHQSLDRVVLGSEIEVVELPPATKDTYRFWSWDGHVLSITVPAGTPVSARTEYDRTNHRPLGFDLARHAPAPKFQLLIHGRRGHELIVGEVDCPECLAEMVADGEQV